MVVSSTSSSVSPTMPPVATTTPSLTRGDALPMRLMAPSTMTSSAPKRQEPIHRDAELGERRRAAYFLHAPPPAARPMTTRPSGVWTGSSGSASIA